MGWPTWKTRSSSTGISPAGTSCECTDLKEKSHQNKTMLYFEDDHLRRNVSVGSGPSDEHICEDKSLFLVQNATFVGAAILFLQ